MARMVLNQTILERFLTGQLDQETSPFVAPDINSDDDATCRYDELTIEQLTDRRIRVSFSYKKQYIAHLDAYTTLREGDILHVTQLNGTFPVSIR